MMRFRKKKGVRNPRTLGRASLTYYRSAAPAPSSPFKKARPSRKRHLFNRGIDWLLILAAIGGIVYCLILRGEPTVATSSNDYHSNALYLEATTAKLKEPKYRTKLTFDEQSLANRLKEQFPEINNVSVELPIFGQQPKIYLEVSEPSLVVKGAVGTYGAASRLVVDAKGTVIGPLEDFPSISNLTLVADNTGFTARSGETLLSASDINFILTVIAQAKKAGVPITSLTLPKQAEELELRTTDQSYFVRFYLGGDALTQSGQFLAARQHFDKTKSQPSRYLDVRVAGKIFYK